jgi:hypothetical protein
MWTFQSEPSRKIARSFLFPVCILDGEQRIWLGSARSLDPRSAYLHGEGRQPARPTKTRIHQVKRAESIKCVHERLVRSVNMSRKTNAIIRVNGCPLSLSQHEPIWKLTPPLLSHLQSFQEFALLTCRLGARDREFAKIWLKWLSVYPFN